MTMTWILFLLGATFFAFIEARSFPARYDQRQEGDFNVHAKLENLFFVVIPSNTEQLNNLALGALEHVVSRSKEQESIRVGEEPYTVEIIQINEKENSVRKTEGADAEALNVTDQQSSTGGQTEKTARNIKFEFPKSREVPTIRGYFVNTRKKTGLKTGNSNRARNVWNPDIELGRSGTSLKEQLPRRDEKSPSPNAENNVPSVTEELILLGDGIENCGPGSHRDASGICHFDDSLH